MLVYRRQYKNLGCVISQVAQRNSDNFMSKEQKHIKLSLLNLIARNRRVK